MEAIWRPAIRPPQMRSDVRSRIGPRLRATPDTLPDRSTTCPARGFSRGRFDAFFSNHAYRQGKLTGHRRKCRITGSLRRWAAVSTGGGRVSRSDIWDFGRSKSGWRFVTHAGGASGVERLVLWMRRHRPWISIAVWSSVVTAFATVEIRTSWLQSRLLTAVDRQLVYHVERGAGPTFSRALSDACVPAFRRDPAGRPSHVAVHREP